MKGSPKIVILMLIVMATVLILSALFAVVKADFYSAYGSAVSSSPSIPPYYELAYIVSGIIIITAVFLVLIKYRLGKVIVGVSALIYFFVLLLITTLTLGAASFYLFHINILLASTSSYFIGFLMYAVPILVLIYYFRFAGIYGRNITNILIFSAIAEIIASLLGVVPSLILIGVIAIYDYIAVFVTKHMVTLAKALAGSPMFSGIEFMAKKEKMRFVLGGGDLVFPAVVFDAFMLNGMALAAAAAGAGAIIGLLVLMLLGKKNKAYPAMAVIAPMQFLFLGLLLI